MRDCKKCKHLIMYDYKNKSYSCEKWECKFEPKEQEPKTGHWTYIRNSEVNGLKIVECSECGKRSYGSGNYCPNCGAKMAESEDKE